ncbi:hypothetical protein SLNWT_6495 [Streptomyces albus]|uniref:Uncharacterized protein n=1 Tax=Streptomyces albus (strain ATCC 21838 / DSM 41398 / FERM P-419 / JCM 4703 / NBRC 107858) TaxID=1081613 RepID=A0A0B5F7S4_STRA4|nr:hypothetical protein SLNWT_6495 [Streptomyces albus]AOU81175.1 hypothetical protein SLNHY_6484 [Streptomyces albus]
MDGGAHRAPPLPPTPESGPGAPAERGVTPSGDGRIVL